MTVEVVHDPTDDLGGHRAILQTQMLGHRNHIPLVQNGELSPPPP